MSSRTYMDAFTGDCNLFLAEHKLAHREWKINNDPDGLEIVKKWQHQGYFDNTYGGGNRE